MLMRISPLPIALRNLNEKELNEIVEKECQITHSNPIVIQASQFYVRVLVNLLKGQKPKEAIANSAKSLNEKLILDIVADSEHQSTPVRLLDGRKVDGDKECMGYFGVALQVALHELQTSNSFEQSMIRIMEIGGDTDTNGCIAGVLLGAHLGRKSIPRAWIDTVLNAPIDRDFSFMEPLKNRRLDEFIRELASLS